MSLKNKKINLFFTLCFALISLVVFSGIIFSGCNSDEDLSVYLSEYRNDIFEGESQNYRLNAEYGFKEEVFSPDGNVGKTIYLLIFTLDKDGISDGDYSLSFDYDGKNYKNVFSLSPATDKLQAKFEITGFNEKSFTVNVSIAETSEQVTLSSVLPENIISVKEALSSIKNSTTVFDSYANGAGYDMELTARLSVKNGNAYYYIGITDKNSKMKALLVDGKTGEVLARRDVF